MVAYNYKTQALATPGEGSADRILSYAHNLVAELYADRIFANAENRPLIFICHGIGGLLVKRALVFSSTRRAKNIEHLRSIYVSTYAIMFLGTPHDGINKDSLFLSQDEPGPSQFLISLLKESEMIREITDMFAPLMKQFVVYNFWEQMETQSKTLKTYIVDKESAAPGWDNVERCGIRSTHSGMAKMRTTQDRGYRVIEAALKRYIALAPDLIRARRRQEQLQIENERKAKAEALLHSHSHTSVLEDTPTEGLNEWFLVNRSPTPYFTGRRTHADHVKESLAAYQKRHASKRPSIFMVCGLGGSGKTQFCLKYAWDNCSR